MSEPIMLPVLPLRDIVLFPGVTLPIAVGRPGTLRTLEHAQKHADSRVLAVAQRRNTEEVTSDGLYSIGTIARIEQVQRTLSGIQVLVHGENRGIAMRYDTAEDDLLNAMVRHTEEMLPSDEKDAAFLALYREARLRAAELGQKSGLPREAVQQVLAGVKDPGRLADLVAGYLDVPLADRQHLLETLSVEERLRRVLIHVQRQINVFEAQEDLQSKVQEELGDRQREIYLREQMKAIQRELGDEGDDRDLEELRQKLDTLDLPEEARKEVDREFKRLNRFGREAMEGQVIRTFLETVTELPWNERSDEQLDLHEAETILNEDHYGLAEVKDRVLEFLAVRQLKQAISTSEEMAQEKDVAPDQVEADQEAFAATILDDAHDAPTLEWSEDDLIDIRDMVPESSEGGSSPEAPSPETVIKETESTDEQTASGEKAGGESEVADKTEGKAIARGPIMLFVGPPGVGKTSLAKSIARSMGREYVRVSLGGARDEADIRGHRRTYVGAMPGRIIKGLKQAGAKNPVFLLDEIDKLGASFHGDPASALLEVLDPAQNDSFTDHYMGIPFDLSEVLFICTANFLQNIPGPLLDRMELVEFHGYTEGEKLEIARQYLMPRQLERNGLREGQVEITDEAIGRLTSEYTRESGVRQLEREIGRLFRKVARKIASGEIEHYRVAAEQVQELLGRPKVHPEKKSESDQIGVSTGMYYTPTGGDIMFVEATTMRGKGELVLTGQLGDVMKESARAAWSYARAHAEALHIDSTEFENDIHIHVPAGAIPKDGPSAGVTMATALVSTLSRRPVRHDLAMTGEITLNGRVLPIGGVKEKILGSVRAGIRNFIIPFENEADLEDIPEEVLRMIKVTPVQELGEVLALALRDASYRDGRLLFGDERPEDVTPLSSAFEN